eukprot:3179832-Prymnesium_polylepis.1
MRSFVTHCWPSATRPAFVVSASQSPATSRWRSRRVAPPAIPSWCRSASTPCSRSTKQSSSTTRQSEAASPGAHTTHAAACRLAQSAAAAVATT